MPVPQHTAGVPIWAYLRAMLFAFLAMLAIDWLAYALFDRWMDWRMLIPIAVIWPVVMVRLT
ncbi:MAG: hypothetical protein V4808_15440 [Pseudomonadota bacterium]